MAYDQYGASSEQAGTTAGYNWIELNLKKFLETYEVESEKLILAVPFYARLWTIDSSGNADGRTAIPMNEIEETIPSDVERKWDDELKQNYVEYTEDGETKKMWIEDIDSLKEKISLIKEYDLGGIAAWELGMESDGVWQMINQELSGQ